MNDIDTLTIAILFLVLSSIIFAYTKRFSSKGYLSRGADQLITLCVFFSVINILLFPPQKYLIGIGGFLLTVQAVVLILCYQVPIEETTKLLAEQRKEEKRSSGA